MTDKEKERKKAEESLNSILKSGQGSKPRNFEKEWALEVRYFVVGWLAGWLVEASSFGVTCSNSHAKCPLILLFLLLCWISYYLLRVLYVLQLSVGNIVGGAVGAAGVAVLAPTVGLAQGAKHGGILGGIIGVTGGAVVGVVGAVGLAVGGKL